jgi:hypothetical protein
MCGFIHYGSLLLKNIRHYSWIKVPAHRSHQQYLNVNICIAAASQQSPTLRPQCASVLSQLQECTLQQSTLLAADTERSTGPHSDVSVAGPNRTNSAAA